MIANGIAPEAYKSPLSLFCEEKKSTHTKITNNLLEMKLQFNLSIKPVNAIFMFILYHLFIFYIYSYIYIIIYLVVGTRKKKKVKLFRTYEGHEWSITVGEGKKDKIAVYVGLVRERKR